MSKTNIRKVTYTPVFDNLIDEFGLYTAAVFGRVWRYCQMERGYCHAEQTRIADELGVKRETVNRSLKVLVVAGYLADTTPNTKGRTRIYRDTGKAGHIVLPEPVSEVVSEVVSDPVSLSHTKIVKKEKKEKTLLQLSGSGEDINSKIQEQEQEHHAKKNKGNAKELAFLDTASDEQAKAYRLVRQVSNIDTAIEKAMSETPIEAAISLLEWHAENGTSNSRTASALLDKIRKAERREENIRDYDDNVRDVQHCLIKEVNKVYGDISLPEMNAMWSEYLKICEHYYEDKDKYEIFADGYMNREGDDDRAHYERIELFVKQRGERDDAAADALDAAAQVNSSVTV